MTNTTRGAWRKRARHPAMWDPSVRVLVLLDALLTICEGRDNALAEADTGDLPHLAEAMREVAAALTYEAGALEEYCADHLIVAGEASATPSTAQPGLFDTEPGPVTRIH